MLILTTERPCDTLEVMQKIRSYLQSFLHPQSIKGHLGLLGVAILLMAIPLTVFLLRQSQDIRQRAATSSQASGYALGSAFFAPAAPFDINTGYTKLSEVAHVAWIGRGWDDADNPSPDADIARARSHGMKIYLAFDPLCTDRKRVSSLSQFVTHNKDDCDATLTPSPLTHFQDAGYKETYVNGVKAWAATYHPEYFIIGHEFNIYKEANSADYSVFVNTIYADAYQAIKSVSPQTQVGVSFTYNPNFPSANNAALHAFVTDFTTDGRHLDMLPISFYPQFYIGDNPDNLSDDIFVQMNTAAGSNLPLFITETGWINVPYNGFPASNDGQARYMTKLKDIAEYSQTHGLPISVINYVALVDRTFCNYDDPAIKAQIEQNPAGWFCFLGLLNYQGLPKTPTDTTLSDAYTQMKQWKTELDTPATTPSETPLTDTPTPTLPITITPTELPITPISLTPTMSTPTPTEQQGITPTSPLTITPTVTTAPGIVTPTNTPGVTPTHALTPTPTSIAVTLTSAPHPTHTPMPTPTLGQSTTKLAFSLTLTGIGDTSLAQTTPLHPQRTITVRIFDTTNTQVLETTGLLTFSSSTKKFEGTIDLRQTVTSGLYTVKVQTDGFLQKLIPGIQNIQGTTPLSMPAVTLVAGDINSDNTIDILDFNILRSCYGAGTPTCSSTNQLHADLDDNGSVDGIDYNLFLRGITQREGD